MRRTLRTHSSRRTARRMHSSPRDRANTPEDRSTEDSAVLRAVSHITEMPRIRTRTVPTTADSSISSITETRTSTQTRISSMITTRDMDRIRIRTETATMLRRRTSI